MSMLEWAEREVEIAKKYDEDSEWNVYFNMCAESALKAFKSLCEDDHSGLSIIATQKMLNSLIDGRPLTPIEDAADIWRDVTIDGEETKKVYQCTRMSALFKDIIYDGDKGCITYSDMDRVICHDGFGAYKNGFFRDLIDEQFPITMPYMPASEPYKLYFKHVVLDDGKMEYEGIVRAIDPYGEEFEPSWRYFKEGDKTYIRISKEEWDYACMLEEDQE